MEFTVTKEQILEFANWGNPDNKKKLKEWFPKAFEAQLEVGKWYKTRGGCMFFLTRFRGEQNKGYGFNKNGLWVNSSDSFFGYKSDIASEATTEEVESALIAEAKKRGFKKGALCAFGGGKYKRQLETNDFMWERNRLMVSCHDDSKDIIFQDGIWATILPEEKTIITKGKALRIIAKKLKVSPESIEIK